MVASGGLCDKWFCRHVPILSKVMSVPALQLLLFGIILLVPDSNSRVTFKVVLLLIRCSELLNFQQHSSLGKAS
jgi:hypothetical protein